MSWRVLITCPPMLSTLDECKARLEEENLYITAPKITQQMSEEQLCEIIGDFDGVIAGDDPFSAKVLEAGCEGRLKVLAKWGIGVDAIDLEVAKRLGILTSNTPDAFGDEVADMALGYLLLLTRHLHKIDAAVRQGAWLKIPGTSVRGKTAGIIGLGSIGQSLAKRLYAMGMTVLGHDVDSGKNSKDTSAEMLDLDSLIQQSDYIFLACSLTPGNYHVLDQSAFSKMKQGVSVINVARGPLIDETALVAALDTGKVGSAALDVFEEEPVAAGHPLMKYPQVVLGSHNASNTREAVLRTNQRAIDNLVRDLQLSQRIMD